MNIHENKNNTQIYNLSKKHKTYFSIVSLVVGMLVFIIAYMGMGSRSGIGAFDQPILAWMVNNRNDIVTIIAKIVTNLASPWFSFTLSALIIGIWVLYRRELLRPVLLAFSMLITAIISTIMKAATMNGRPEQINMIPQFEINYSFPSGHTIIAAVFLLVFGYLIYSRNFSRKRFTAWIIYAVLGTGIIAFSRLYLGYHWLTDVVASIGLGLIILSVIIIVDILLNKYSSKIKNLLG